MSKFIIFLRIFFIFGVYNWIWMKNCAVSAKMRLSEKKCEEYAESLRPRVYMDLMMNTEPIPVSLNCTPSVTSMILGGQFAEKNEFPHMVGIGWKLRDGREKILYMCSGSLISKEWVLSAAHCTHGILGKPEFLRLGNSDLVQSSNETIVLEISEIHRHPRYSPPALYGDIALIRLAKPLDRFSKFIKPACLHTQFESSPTKVWATGWGLMNENTTVQLGIPMRRIALEVVDNFRCHKVYNRSIVVPRGIVPSMMCAGDPHGQWTEDTCVGDSGGPLQILHSSNCLYRIIGLTSFGRLCASYDTPGVYTRISHYLKWIERIVWKT